MWYRTSILVMGVAILMLAGGAGCRQQQQQDAEDESLMGTRPASPTGDVTMAVAVMHRVEGAIPMGTVTFSERGDSMRVLVHLTGVPPGDHGFHVHEFGDCSDPLNNSMGGHFNPEGVDHGAPATEPHHTGDMGNLSVGPDSMAHADFFVDKMTFEDDHSILGRAVVLHTGTDDFVSQPSGNSGPPLACGVIGIARPQSATGTERMPEGVTPSGEPVDTVRRIRQ
ncbi:MAG: superoxide dismutase family protein [Candidatus Zixiibacteriota bacterium]|nr:MAG: superoxide dismutase family protein [candidate division Zixibacteria bacterium]